MVATGVVLELYKAGAQIAVADQWVFLYGRSLAPTGREDLELMFADSALQAQLSDDPGHRLIAEVADTFLYARTR